MNKKNKIIVLIILVILVIYIILEKYTKSKNVVTLNEILVNDFENSENIDEKSSDTGNNNEDDMIIVYITGAIKNQGVYELNVNSRLSDLIEKSGGLLENSDISGLNLAYILQDGIKIYIPQKGENVNNMNDDTNQYIIQNDVSTESGTSSISISGKININKATQAELETLPGVGPSTALKIINYRKENGNFKKIEDIKNVSRNRR